MSYQTLLLDIADGVARITLNRPDRLNAFTNVMAEELGRAIDAVANDDDARVLVLTGAGRGFSSGADLSPGDLAPGSLDAGEGLELYFNPVVEKLWALPKPFVTVVNGPAAGAGCSLALLGDIIVAAESAFFLQAFVNIGLVPDVGATWVLPRQVGRARAMAMMMLGERIPAAQAEQWGMIWKCVPDAKLADEAEALVRKLAAGPTQTYGLIRKGVFESLTSDASTSLDIERRHQRIAGFSPDFAEGVSAFLGKRPPQFSGR